MGHYHRDLVLHHNAMPFPWRPYRGTIFLKMEVIQEMPATGKSEGTQDEGTSRLQAEHVNPRDREAVRAKLQAANFGNIVTVLMQSPHHKDLPLSELAHLVVPALLNNQFNVAEAQNKDTGYTVPAAVALWARVSEDVDKRLVDNIREPIRLSAQEWRSGDIFWLIEVLGDARFIPPMLDQLNNTVFKGKSVKYRTVNTEGIASVKQLQNPES
jgi:cytolysin-activating lysine-acyltransferase